MKVPESLTWCKVVFTSLVYWLSFPSHTSRKAFSSLTVTLLRSSWVFSKQNLLWLPSAHHRLTGLVWKSSDGGQQMHRKCFWSNEKGLSVRKEEGGKSGCDCEYTCAWRLACAFVFLCVVVNTGCRLSDPLFLPPGRFPTLETDAGANPTVSRLRCVSERPGAICGGAGGEWLVCDVILFIETPWDENIFFFFMNREEGWGNSCMPDQLALMAIVKFFFPPQLFLYGPLKGADASILLPSVPSQEYSASLFISSLSFRLSHGGLRFLLRGRLYSKLVDGWLNNHIFLMVHFLALI